MFIKSQEYTNSFNKRSKNILDLGQQSDYRISINPETGKYDVASVVGEIEKYIFSADTEDDCDLIMQNMFNGHATREPHAICDIEDIMCPVDELGTLEDVEDKIYNVMSFFGYTKLMDKRDEKLNEECNAIDDDNLDITIEFPKAPMDMVKDDSQPTKVESKVEMYPAIYHI